MPGQPKDWMSSSAASLWPAASDAPEMLLSSVLGNIPGAVYRCEPEPPWPMHILTEGIEEISGYPARAFLRRERNYGTLIPPEDCAVVDAQIARAASGQQAFVLEYRLRHRDGTLRWLFERGRGTFDDRGRLLWLDGVIFDVTSRKAAERNAERSLRALDGTVLELKGRNAQLAALAFTDPLTGLHNRRSLLRRLGELLAEARRGRSFALALLDVDAFKHFNDSFGHPSGDAAIAAIAQAIRHGVREIDTVARYGGDEFCILFVDVDEAAGCELADRVRRLISHIPDPHAQLTVTVGVAAVSPAMRDEHALLAAADHALYRAKARGYNCVQGFSGNAAGLNGGARGTRPHPASRPPGK